MNHIVAKECTILSDEEKISFPEVVKRLVESGYELYYADMLSSTKTYYRQNEAFTVNCRTRSPLIISETFNSSQIIQSIRESQGGKIKYQEFLKKIMDAGVFGYTVFLTGKKAVYFGKKGEQHVEEFPR